MAVTSSRRMAFEAFASASHAVGDNALAGFQNASLSTRGGRKVMSPANQLWHWDYAVPNGTAWVVGRRIWVDSQDSRLLAFRTGSADILTVWLNINRFLEVRRGATVLATGTVPLVLNGEYYIQISCKLDASTGDFEVRCTGGVDTISATGVNTQNAAGGCSVIRFGGQPGTDEYIEARSGGAGTGFPGPLVIYTLDAATTVNGDFTAANGGDQHDEIQTPHDGDSTYNESATPGDFDAFTHEGLPPGVTGQVRGVAVLTIARKPNGGDATINHGVSKNGQTDQGSALEPGDTQYGTQLTVFPNDPETDAPWADVAAVDAAAFGYGYVSP